MSDETAILPCFQWFLGYPRTQLVQTKYNQDVKSVGSSFIENAFIGNILTRAMSK